MKVPNWLAVTVEMFGGWFSTMSGAVSVPLAIFALIWGGPPQLWFAALAFIALLISAASAAWHHHRTLQLWNEERLKWEKQMATASESYEQKIQSLNVQLDDRQKSREKEIDRRIAKEGLGAWRSRLSTRIRDLGEMYYFEYNNKYREVPPGRFDPDTLEIMEGTAEFLGKNFSWAEQEFYLSKEGLEMTRGVSDDERKWRAVLDHLHQHARQLDKIIERQI